MKNLRILLCKKIIIITFPTDFLNNISLRIIHFSIDTLNNKIYVVDIENNSSAHKKGVMIGDLILQINDILLEGKSISDFHSLLVGQANTKVKLKVLRNNTEIDFDLTRQKIEIPVVSLVRKIDNFGYIKLENFSDKSAMEFRSAFTDLNKQKIDGLIIDLRDNPGGLLDHAVMIVNLFIDKDLLVVSSMGKSQNSNASFYTKQKPLDTKTVSYTHLTLPTKRIV